MSSPSDRASERLSSNSESSPDIDQPPVLPDSPTSEREFNVQPDPRLPKEPYVPHSWNHVLRGTWITSFAGFVQAIPRWKKTPATGCDPERWFFGYEDLEPPPVIPGYKLVESTNELPNGTWEQIEGYFTMSALLHFTFDGAGIVSGTIDLTRGRHSQLRTYPFNGNYSVVKQQTPAGFLYTGSITTQLVGGPKWNFQFHMRTPTEIEWLWTPQPEPLSPPLHYNPPRPILARGTMRKVGGFWVVQRAFRWLTYS